MTTQREYCKGFPTFFHNPTEGGIIRVDGPSSLPIDLETNQPAADLTLDGMRKSDNWFEYPTLAELFHGGSR
jgi:hypothetical protein